MEMLRKWKRSLPVLLTFALTGCSIISTTPTPTPAPSPTPTVTAQAPQPVIAMLGHDMDAPFWQALAVGAKNAAADYGIRLTISGPTEAEDGNAQAADFDSLLASSPDAICVAPQDNALLLPYIEEAHSKGVLVIEFESSIQSDIIKNHVDTDYAALGTEAAERLAQAVETSGEIALFLPDEFQSRYMALRDAFTAKLEEAYTDVKLIAIESVGDDRELAAYKAMELFATNPNIVGIFAAGERCSQGALDGLEQGGMQGRVTLIGFGAGAQQKEAVRTQIMAGAFTLDPISIGYRTIETAYNALQLQQQEYTNTIPYTWYDANNVDAPEMRSKLYD